MSDTSERETGQSALERMMPPEPDFTRLPLVLHIGSTPLLGVVLIMAGGFFPVVIFIVLTLIGLVSDVPPAYFWIKTAFAVIPVPALLCGWWVLKSRTLIEFDTETVRWARVTPLGEGAWSEPLSSFGGLVFRKVLPKSTTQDRFASWVVELDHPDRHRRPRLANTQDQDKARQMLDGVARLTGLPVLADDGA